MFLFNTVIKYKLLVIVSNLVNLITLCEIRKLLISELNIHNYLRKEANLLIKQII